MALPNAPGWLIDYPAASEICSSASARQLAKLNRLCASGKLLFCFNDKALFTQDAVVKKYFWDNQQCWCPICDGVAGVAMQFPPTVNGKKFNPTDHSQKIIGATAIFHSYGVISNKKGIFVNCSDILIGTGLYVLDPAVFLSCL